MTSNKVLRDELLNCRTMFAALAMQVGEWRHAANEAILRIDGALSQPPRNCDRPFRLVEEAIGAYVTERGDGTHLGYCDAIKWMLAPEEGGAE